MRNPLTTCRVTRIHAKLLYTFSSVDRNKESRTQVMDVLEETEVLSSVNLISYLSVKSNISLIIQT
jgi:hypothetical protein